MLLISKDSNLFEIFDFEICQMIAVHIISFLQKYKTPKVLKALGVLNVK
jgi:hypothetical protein